MIHPENGILIIVKKKEKSSHEKVHRKLICILLTETSQSENSKYYMISTTWHLGKRVTMEIEKSSLVDRWLGEGRLNE